MSETEEMVHHQHDMSITVEELSKLASLVSKFADKMFLSVVKSHCEGRRGWATARGWGTGEDMSPDDAIEQIVERLKRNVRSGQPLDVAIYAAFWLNIRGDLS